MTDQNLQKYCITPNNTIKDVIKLIDDNKNGIALVCDPQKKLIGTITDGDIRRFMLAGRSIDEPCSNVMSHNPFSVPDSSPRGTLIETLQKNKLRQLPLVNAKGEVTGLFFIKNLLEDVMSPVAVIMAGGEGRRLRPLTDTIPKPMIKVGDEPVLKRIIDGLSQAGIKNVFISINYLGETIKEYFGNGSKFGVNINYLAEKEKLGTGGALSLLPNEISSPCLILNGDVVTDINFSNLVDFHIQHNASMTVAAAEYNVAVPYGVLELADHYVLGLKEKPSHKFMCNAGVYAINASLLRLVPKDTFYNMTDLLQDTINLGLHVAAFPIREYWTDIGRKEDLDRANLDLEATQNKKD